MLEGGTSLWVLLCHAIVKLWGEVSRALALSLQERVASPVPSHCSLFLLILFGFSGGHCRAYSFSSAQPVFTQFIHDIASNGWLLTAHPPHPLFSLSCFSLQCLINCYFYRYYFKSNYELRKYSYISVFNISSFIITLVGPGSIWYCFSLPEEFLFIVNFLWSADDESSQLFE